MHERCRGDTSNDNCKMKMKKTKTKTKKKKRRRRTTTRKNRGMITSIMIRRKLTTRIIKIPFQLPHSLPMRVKTHPRRAHCAPRR